MLSKIFLLLLPLVLAQDFKDSHNEVLVLYDSWANANAFSSFLDPLKEKGVNIKSKLANDTSLTLMRYGDYAYKSVIILAPGIRLFGGKLDVKSLTKFVDDGGNLFIAADSNVGEAIRELAAEFGVEIDAASTYVTDHFNIDIADEGLHTRLVLPRAKSVINSEVMVGPMKNDLLLYEGVGLSVDPSNPLITEIMWAPESSYSNDPSKALNGKENSIGDGTKLIVSYQNLNTNSRVVICGSIKFLSDKFMNSLVKNRLEEAKPRLPGNMDISQNLVSWLAHEQGVLRIKALKHHKVGELTPPWEYTIKDNIHFEVDIEAKTSDGKWVPYVANDVQLSLIRIDPFIRLNLPHTGNHYSVQFILPDVYGVFKLVIDYRHTGYSYLSSVNEISIRPLRHTEYERFITAAFPYYAGAFSMLIGVFLLSFVYLYYKDVDVHSSKKKD